MNNLAQKLFNFNCQTDLTLTLDAFENWFDHQNFKSGIVFYYTVYMPYTEKVIRGEVFLKDHQAFFPLRDTFNLAAIFQAINVKEKLWVKGKDGINKINAESLSFIPDIINIDKDSLHYVMSNMFNVPVYVIER